MKNSSPTPSQFERRLLLAVAGTTPQILTETLYALVHAEKPFVPTEVHVMTTSEGAHRIDLQLLDEQHGKFHEFCRDYGLEEKIKFSRNQLKVLTNEEGEQLKDIVSPLDNQLAADQITDWLRTFTLDSSCAIHACLAGGRKTMGFYLGYGMSLYGREQDRLSHVLVTPEFEGHKEFFYVPPEPKTLYVANMVGNRKDERPVSTKEAKIWLAEIPFVRLRNGLPDRLLKGKANYSEAVDALQEALPESTLEIDLSNRAVRMGGVEVKMSPRELAFYLWHVRRRLNKTGDVSISSKDASGGNNPLVKEYLACYLEVQRGDEMQPDYIEAKKSLEENGFEKDHWSGIVHHIRKLIRNALGARGAGYNFTVKRKSGAGRLEYLSIEIPTERIRIETGLTRKPSKSVL